MTGTAISPAKWLDDSSDAITTQRTAIFKPLGLRSDKNFQRVRWRLFRFRFPIG